MTAPTPAAEKSDATRRAYRSDFDRRVPGCSRAGPADLPRYGIVGLDNATYVRMPTGAGGQDDEDRITQTD
jgi:hypothetical protein